MCLESNKSQIQKVKIRHKLKHIRVHFCWFSIFNVILMEWTELDSNVSQPGEVDAP